MAFTKYISAIVLITYFSFHQLTAAPTTEYGEFRANQAESMRAQRISINHAPALNRVAPQEDRSCLASFAHVFFTLMEHAANAAPHPTIYTRRNN